MKRQKKASPLLAAKFIARQVSIELAKMFQNIPMPTTDLPGSDPDGEEYGLNDHVERLRYLELEVIPEESELLRNVLRYALPGLEGAVTDERYAILLGKMAYNLFGVCFAGDDKVCVPVGSVLLLYLTSYHRLPQWSDQRM
jgi:mitochondrial import receptor subunit TOM20